MSAATTARDADLDEPPTQANASPPKEGRGHAASDGAAAFSNAVLLLTAHATKDAVAGE